MKDRVTGAVTLVSQTPGGFAGNGDSRNASFWYGGNRIVFTSCADNLVPNDTNQCCDVFMATTNFTPTAGPVTAR